MSKNKVDKNSYEVAIIGGGIMGTALFSELVRTGINCILLEAGDDVSNGSTKANSGIIHAGYDPKPNSLMAKFNVRGNDIYPNMCKRLGVGFKQCGTLVVAHKNEREKLEALFTRGRENKVPRMRIIEQEELHQMEPNLNDDITCALFAETGAIVSPYLVCIALAEEGIVNGGQVLCNFFVNEIIRQDDYYTVVSKSENEQKSISAKYLVNCAGAGADKINTLVGLPSTPCTYVKGEYILLDKSQNNFVHHPIFPLPNEISKGILAIPTIHGNVMFGPTAIQCTADDTAVDPKGLDEIKEKVTQAVKKPNFRKTIKLFAGVRNKCGNDFVIEKAPNIPHFFYTLGIQSPGLTSAPAIAEYLRDEIIKDGATTKKIKFIPRKPYPDFTNITDAELKTIIKKNPDYGKIVCRCENISLGEIKDTLHSPLRPRSVDAIKRRMRPTMGRCQGGFCLPKLIKIISTECNIPKEEVTLCGKGSEFIIGNLKENGFFEKRKVVKVMVEKVKNS